MLAALRSHLKFLIADVYGSAGFLSSETYNLLKIVIVDDAFDKLGLQVGGILDRIGAGRDRGVRSLQLLHCLFACAQ